jgi:hypothetical protein
MPTITLEQWKDAISPISVFKRSQQLTDLTKAFEIYDQRKSSANLQLLATRFADWRNFVSAKIQQERAIVGASVETDFETTISTANQSNVVITAKATNVTNVGWVPKAWDAVSYSWTAALPVASRQPALTPPQIMRVNEALRRTKFAVESARDALILMARKASFGPTLSADEQSYVHYFGPFDAGRVKKVLANFKTLYGAFTSNPVVVDLRNTAYGTTCYAACFRGTVTQNLEIFMGRVFLARGDYESSTDTTVGTLVHEFAHGSLNCIDAPPLDASGNWVLTPKHLADETHADFGESPINSVQASTVALDRALAARYPKIALRNADNYGQFAKEQLLRKTA